MEEGTSPQHQKLPALPAEPKGSLVFHQGRVFMAFQQERESRLALKSLYLELRKMYEAEANQVRSDLHCGPTNGCSGCWQNKSCVMNVAVASKRNWRSSTKTRCMPRNLTAFGACMKHPKKPPRPRRAFRRRRRMPLLGYLLRRCQYQYQYLGQVRYSTWTDT